jgi:hypothetical protein
MNASFKEEYEKIETFVSSVHPGFKNFIGSERSKFGLALKNLYFYYFITNYISCRNYISSGDEISLLSIFSKSALDVLGIFNCLSNGLQIQSQILERSLFESYVTFEYILKDDTTEKLKLFRNFSNIEKWLKLELSIRKDPTYPEKIGMTKDDIEAYRNQYEKVRIDYHPTHPYHWAYKCFKESKGNRNPSLRNLCEDIGPDCVDDYDSFYAIGSLAAHPSFSLTSQFADTNSSDNNAVIVNSPRFNDTIYSSCFFAMHYSSRISEKLIRYFEKDNESLAVFVRDYPLWANKNY